MTPLARRAALLLVHTNLAQDPITWIVATLISSGAPYLVYLGALRAGLPVTLDKLSATKLSWLALIYALASSGLHSFWFAVRGV